MIKYIEGAVGEDRALTFEVFDAHIGETNGNMLKIDVSQIESGSPEYYILTFEASPLGEVFGLPEIKNENSKPAFLKDGFIYCPVTDRMTKSGSLKIQLSAFYADEDGVIREEKTDIATLEFEPSLLSEAEYPEDEAESRSEILKLKARLDKVYSFTKEFSFDYFASALASRLLFKDSTKTPVYFPETAESVDSLLLRYVEEFVLGETEYIMTVIPSTESECAKLCIFKIMDDEARIDYYSGNELLELLLNGVEI